MAAHLEDFGVLKGADLREAYLVGTNLFNACLQRTNLRGARLTQADLRRAHLERAMNVTVEQLRTVKTLYKTHLELSLLEQIQQQCPQLLEKPSK